MEVVGSIGAPIAHIREGNYFFALHFKPRMNTPSTRDIIEKETT